MTFPNSPSRRESHDTHRWREALICANAALLYSAPFLLRLNNWGIHDWELFTAMGEIPRTLIFKFGQFPFWNPYLGGGNILFHHPEVATLSPLYLLPLLFGAVVGLKLQVVVCYFLGFWGSVRFARALGVSEPGGYLFAVIYFGSTHFALHFAEGHIPFTQFCFLPWVGYFWLRSFVERRFVLHGAAALALMILGNGAAAPFLLSATFLGALAILASVHQRAFRPLSLLLFMGVGGVGLAAVKFIPMLVYLLQNPWGGSPGDVVPFAALGKVFFGFEQAMFDNRALGLAGGWHEYGAYLSPLALALALWALAQKFRERWMWAGLALVFLLIGLGGFADWAPWKLLSHLPGFSSSRAPGRMFQFVLFSGGILAAFGLDGLVSLLRKRANTSGFTVGVYSVVFGVVFLTNLLLAHESLAQSFTREPLETHWNDEFTMTVGDPLYVYQGVRENRGSINVPWLSAYQEGRGLVMPNGSVASEFALSGEVEIQSRRYAGNEITYEISAANSGELTLGMGYDPGWSIVEPDGWKIRDEQGLITVAFQPGDHRISLRYRTPYFWTGAIVTLLTLLVFSLWYLRTGRMKSRM